MNYGLLAAFVLWYAALQLAKWLAKIDPLAFRVYLRHRKYQDYYPARSGVNCVRRNVPGRWNLPEEN